MIQNKKVLAVIPARGGSKGVPYKNVRELAGKPLLAWTIEEAKKSKYIDWLILSSEDSEIIEVAKKYRCEVPFVRPSELAQDGTSGIAPILHALDEIQGYDYVVVLQPTSPLRVVEDIDNCIEEMIKTDSPSCVSVTETSSSPFWMYTVNDQKKMVPLLTEEKYSTVRRQDLPSVYILNGAVYVADINWLKQHETFLTEDTIAFVMPLKRSYDIDTEEDFLWCSFLISNLKK